MTAILEAASISLKPTHQSAGPQPSITAGAGQKFKQALDKAALAPHAPPFGQAFHDIRAMQQRIMSGEQVSPRELIAYQVRAGEFNLQVELVSKVAESVMASLRKFQNGA